MHTSAYHDSRIFASKFILFLSKDTVISSRLMSSTLSHIWIFRPPLQLACSQTTSRRLPLVSRKLAQKIFTRKSQLTLSTDLQILSTFLMFGKYFVLIFSPSFVVLTQFFPLNGTDLDEFEIYNFFQRFLVKLTNGTKNTSHTQNTQVVEPWKEIL